MVVRQGALVVIIMYMFKWYVRSTIRQRALVIHMVAVLIHSPGGDSSNYVRMLDNTSESPEGVSCTYHAKRYI